MSRFVLPAITARLVMWLIHTAARFVRPLTMGVRAVVFDGEGRVFLVRHSYVPGWHFPGGAVEPGETVRSALVRELREEAGLAPDIEPAWHGLFLNRAMSNRDHVAVFVIRAPLVLDRRIGDWEIAERGFFPLDALPPETTRATRARLREIVEGAAAAELW